MWRDERRMGGMRVCTCGRTVMSMCAVMMSECCELQVLILAVTVIE